MLNYQPQVAFDSLDLHGTACTITCCHHSGLPMENSSTEVTPNDFHPSGGSRLQDNLPELHRPTWQNPEQSVGKLYRKLGKFSYWEAKGPALTTFLGLAERIRHHLESSREAVTVTILWCFYMVGMSERTAIPIVFFCSRYAGARRDVRKRIDRSGSVELYPGFKTDVHIPFISECLCATYWRYKG